MKMHGRTLNAHCSVKEASLERLYIVWVQLYDTLEKTKLWEWEDIGCHGVRGGMDTWSLEDF